jgi:hypothetical protein
MQNQVGGMQAPYGMPGGNAPPIPAHLLAGPDNVPARGSMRTWYVVCALAMILVAAVTFIALRYLSG